MKPPWLTVMAPPAEVLERMYRLLREGKLNTVCDWANCPNLGECYRRQTATFMILGNICTRNCSFCAVPKGKPEKVEAKEPVRVAEAVADLGLKHVVITSVTRDDLPDGGAGHFAATVREIKYLNPDTSIEVLIPDFKGDRVALRTVVEAAPDVIGHNLETVPRLYRRARAMARYDRSLQVLETCKKLNKNIFTKSGIMLGLGEQEWEVRQTLQDLRQIGCDFLTLGQYLQPTLNHIEVVEYVPPEKFNYYREMAMEMGFVRVVSSPLARSSYHAEEMLVDL
ncbi:lipoyl synthase [Desulfotomaculum nigrificans]|nr:lipoyl synthase [Desulfotomaculum nigrificans]